MGQSRAVCQSHLFFFLALRMMSVRVFPSAHYSRDCILLSSAMFLNTSSFNSPLSLLNKILGCPYDLSKCGCKVTILKAPFIFTVLPALKLVNESMTFRYHRPGSKSCRSTTTVSFYFKFVTVPQLAFALFCCISNICHSHLWFVAK